MVHMNDNLQEWHGSFVSLMTPSWFGGGPNFCGALCFRILKLQRGICRHGQQNHHINFDEKVKISIGLEPATFGLEDHRDTTRPYEL